MRISITAEAAIYAAIFFAILAAMVADCIWSN
jgi:hypothetical protein